MERANLLLRGDDTAGSPRAAAPAYLQGMTGYP
jgi:hypothetical protein